MGDRAFSVQGWTRLGESSAAASERVARMKTFSKTLNNWRALVPLVVTPVWVVALACFFYVLIRAGLPGQ